MSKDSKDAIIIRNAWIKAPDFLYIGGLIVVSYQIIEGIKIGVYFFPLIWVILAFLLYLTWGSVKRVLDRAPKAAIDESGIKIYKTGNFYAWHEVKNVFIDKALYGNSRGKKAHYYLTIITKERKKEECEITECSFSKKRIEEMVRRYL